MSLSPNHILNNELGVFTFEIYPKMISAVLLAADVIVVVWTLPNASIGASYSTTCCSYC